MTAVDSGVDFRSAPADYAALFQLYHPYVVGLVKRIGVDAQYVEDVAAEILLTLMERDILAEFDENVCFLYNNQIRPARFKSFLTRQVMLYARGLRDKQHRRNARELQVFDDVPLDGSTWLDDLVLVDGHEERVCDDVAATTLIADIRAYLVTIPRRSQFDTCDLPALFDALVGQVRTAGHCTAADLREAFGVSSTAIYTWLRWLRHHVAAYLGRETKGPTPRVSNRDRNRNPPAPDPGRRLGGGEESGGEETGPASAGLPGGDARVRVDGRRL